MSKARFMLEITPDRMGEDNNAEVKIFRGFECPYCHGKKGFTKQVGQSDFETKVCPRCDGVGLLVAKAVVKWEPDYELGRVDMGR